MLNKKIYNNQDAEAQKGFTLIEVVTAVFIAIVGVVGTYGLVNYSLGLANDASMRLAATYLAKEGLEVARNIRNTNYTANYMGEHVDWDRNLKNCSGGCGVDYKSDALLPSCKNNNLYINDEGFYQCAASEQASPYKRTITIDYSQFNVLKVDSRVEWLHGGKSSFVTASENLYNWLEM
jgi:type II secretory pathway pseudopilin PulG